MVGHAESDEAHAASPSWERPLTSLLWILPFVWGAVLGYLWRGFTFFWDEWNVLSASISHPLTSLLQENGGNFFPLSRAVFTAETLIFRYNYGFYVFVTSSLFGLTALILARCVLRPKTTAQVVLASLLAVTYLLTTGVLFASAMGFMLKWALAPLLAVLAIVSYDRIAHPTQRLLAAAGLLSLSALAFSSAAVMMGAFIAGALFLHSRGHANDIRRWIDGGVLFVYGGILGALGTQAAKAFPADDASVAGDPLSGLDLSQPLNALVEAWSAALSAVIAVVTVVPLTDHSVWLRLLFLVTGSGVVLAIVSLVMIGLVAISRSRVALIAALASLAVSMGFLVAFKDPIIVRYEALWALPAILVVWVVVTDSGVVPGRILNVSRWVLAVWISAALVVSATWIPRAGSLERDRYLVDTTRLYAPDTCLDEATTHSEEISPSASPDYVCDVVGRLVGWDEAGAAG